jgi:hypothetical protein
MDQGSDKTLDMKSFKRRAFAATVVLAFALVASEETGRYLSRHANTGQTKSQPSMGTSVSPTVEPR